MNWGSSKENPSTCSWANFPFIETKSTEILKTRCTAVVGQLLGCMNRTHVWFIYMAVHKIGWNQVMVVHRMYAVMDLKTTANNIQLQHMLHFQGCKISNSQHKELKWVLPLVEFTLVLNAVPSNVFCRTLCRISGIIELPIYSCLSFGRRSIWLNWSLPCFG